MEADPGQRENLLTGGEVDLVFSTYSITDERKQTVDFAGPYFEAHQDLLVRRNEEEITGPETPRRHGCSARWRARPPPPTSRRTTWAHRAPGVPEVLRLRRRPRRSEVDAVTTDDVILAGFAADPRVQGQAQGGRRGLLRRALRRRSQEGRHGHGREGQRRAEEVHRRRLLEGRRSTTTVRPSGYKHPEPADPGELRRLRRPAPGATTWHDDRRVDRRAGGGPREVPRRAPAVRPPRRGDPRRRWRRRSGRRVSTPAS